MREYNLLDGYPQPREPRYVAPHLRSITQRIAASYRGREYYDGDRNCGYGGFRYDGRWRPIAERICREYELPQNGALLQIGCEKGFLLYDLAATRPDLKLRGTEISEYALAHAMPPVQQLIQIAPFTRLPFADHEFDFVAAIGVVYTLNLADAIACLREIQRVGKGRSFVTLAAYRNEEEFWLFRQWSLLGTTVLKPEEWLEVLRHAGYTGDYCLTGAATLHLQWARA